MPQPTVNSILVRGALADVSLRYKNDMYVADQVFPIIDGLGRQAKVAKFLKGAWFRNDAGYRAPGTMARRGGYVLTTENLDPKQIAFAKEIPDELREQAAAPGNLPLQPMQEAIEFCADKIDLFKEKVTADAIFSQTWVDGNSGGEDAEGGWGDTTTSNSMITDVITAKQAIRKETGVEPNTLLIDYDTAVAQANNPNVTERIKYTQFAGTATDSVFQLIGAMLGVNVIVGRAIYSTADEKADGTDFDAANIWEKNAGKGSALLFYRPAAPGLYQPTAGYQYRVMRDGMARKTIQWRNEDIHSDIVEVNEEVDIAIVDTSMGYLWKDTHTS